MTNKAPTLRNVPDTICPDIHHHPLPSPKNILTIMKTIATVSIANMGTKQPIIISEDLLLNDVETTTTTTDEIDLPAMEQKEGNLDALDYSIRDRPRIISMDMATEYPEMIYDNMSSKTTTMRDTTISITIPDVNLSTPSRRKTRSSPIKAISSPFNPPDETLSP
jgi:hypothetical protein